jgi:hypothetical protein
MPVIPDDLRPLVDESLATWDWYKAASQLRGDKPADQLPPEVLPLIDGFSYGLTEPGEKSREQWGDFVPMFSGQGFAYPAPLGLVEPGRLREWADLMEEVAHPLVLSRLGDLLWTCKFGAAAHQYCRRAISAYVSLGKSSARTPLYRTYDFIRANELALALNDSELIDHTVEELLAATRRAVEANEPPGITLRLLATLTRLPQKWVPNGVDELLQEAQGLFPTDPFAFETVVTLQLGRAQQDPERRRELAELLVDRWEREAAASAEMLRITHLERALQLAANHGLSNRATRLRVELQEIGEDGLGLKTVSSTVSVPAADVEAYITRFTGDDDWRASITRFGAHCPVELDRAKAEMQVRELREQAPMLSLVARKVMAEGGVHVKTLSTAEELLSYDLIRQECIRINFWATLAVPIVERILALDPPPTVDELAEFFTTDIIQSPVAEAVARAFEHYRRGDNDSSLFTVLPRIETIVRELARRLGVVIIREARGAKPGGYRTLGELLASFDEVLEPQSVVIYLTTLLSEPLGINLRNAGLHGLIERGTRQHAALALHAVSLLRLLQI